MPRASGWTAPRCITVAITGKALHPGKGWSSHSGTGGALVSLVASIVHAVATQLEE